ncbi:poly hydrolase [Cadophora sp. DSE1049]|nr:poly hydrolase [Cadophora sp. DSE1049]
MADPYLLTAAHVPPHYLKHAFLVGNIPFRSLQNDPRVSYKLYIPPSHLNPNPRDPSNTQQLLPLLVVIHGTSRKASELVESLIPFAQEKRCAVLAPLFPMGIDGPDDVDSYKLLRSKTMRSDLAVLSMLEEISIRWPGLSTDKVFLCGYSGGGQFAHRFMYLYPERLHAVSIGAPGRTTLLDKDLDWPHGIQNTSDIFGIIVDPASIAEISSIQLVVGENDYAIYGGNGFSEWLEGMKRKMEDANGDVDRDGNHMERIEKGWAELDIQARLDIVPGVAHDWRGVQGTMLEFLGPLVVARTR